ncbi:8-oxo-dGDP phosphatase NUDT18 [Pseudocercospora fuligena]|uniref:8-oxo-dGDP phosphatase NUDT18 n=1 Tax=Pseudocercospora fuligena TaxID=685502 RepID=A0A8H6RJ49_9PEZI|nr:8-oxo-dGDP phosphatase NUDT18 [Pseudocercospora fuligena]
MTSTSKHSVRLETLLSTKREDLPKGIRYVTGGSIFHPNTSKLLILKRASTDVFPGYWEVPGGSMEPNETVLEGLSREVLEETGLIVESVVYRLEDNELEDNGRKWVQFHFVVEVKDVSKIRLDPKEHEEWMWAREEDVQPLLRLPGQRRVMEEGFQFMREKGRGGKL